MITIGKSKEVPFLKYKKKTSFDPRTKLFILVVFLIAILYSLNIYLLLSLFSISLISVIIVRIKLKFVIYTLLFISVISILATLISYFTVSVENIYLLFAYFEIRFIASFFIINWFFISVTPYELSVALEKMYVPAVLTWLLTTIYQFIPVLSKEVREINGVRKLKGLTAEKWKIKYQFYILRKTLYPLITSSMNRGVDLAEAMVMRGFKPKRRRNHILDLHIRIIDVVGMTLALISLICIIIFFRT